MREMIREYDVKLACTLHSAPLGSFADEAVIEGHYHGYRCHHFQVYFVLHLGTELIGEGASSQTMSPPQRVTRSVFFVAKGRGAKCTARSSAIEYLLIRR